MAGVTGHFIEFVGTFIFVGQEVFLIDLDGHAHHFSGRGFHWVFVGCVIKTIRVIPSFGVAKIAGHAQCFFVLFHDAVELRIGNILGQHLQISFG